MMSPERSKRPASPKPADARHYHHGDLPRALVGAARTLLETQGLRHVTLRGACEQVGVSIAAPYRHFGNRDELLAAVLTEAFEDLETTTRRAWAGQPDPSQALVRLGEAYVRFAGEHPNTYRAMFGEALDKRQHPQLHEAGLRALGVLQNAVRVWLAGVGGDATARKAGAEPEAAITLVAWSMAHGISTLALDGVLESSVGGSHDQAGALFALVVKALTLERRAARQPKGRPTGRGG